jgi:hypothetical protein
LPSWEHLLAIHLLGWLFLGLAIWVLLNRWQDENPLPRSSLQERFRQFMRGSARKRLRIRAKLLAVNPFLWLASRDRFRFFGIWVFTVAMVGVALWSEGRNPGSFFIFVIGASFMHKVMMCGVASSQLLIEHEQGSLEMLLSTPLTSREIIRGQYMAAIRRFRGPALLLLLLHFYAWHAALGSKLALPFVSNAGASFFLLPIYTVMYLFDLHAAARLGIWGATQNPVPQGATGFAVNRLIIAPASLFFIGVILAWLAKHFFGWGIPLSGGQLAVIWFVLGISNNIFWLKQTREKLPVAVWEMAFRRYLPEPIGLIGKLGGILGRYFGQCRQAFGKKRFAAGPRQI